ncbi:MAG: hypothetical protein ACFFB5_09240 [Promethearchaeota archaeon]
MTVLELLILILSIYQLITPFPPLKIIAAPETHDDSMNSEITADWGDVVNVVYSLWLDEAHTIEKAGNINVVLEYIYLRRTKDEMIPEEVVNLFPESAKGKLKQIYVQPFINAIIGMRVNQEKNFTIKAEEHGLSDENFYYHIKILAILFDVSTLTTNIETSTSMSSLTPLTSSSSSKIESSVSTPEISSFPSYFLTILFLSVSAFIINKKKKKKEGK